MDWKKAAIEDLQDYPARLEALENLRERFLALKEEMEAMQSVDTSRVPVQGGASRHEDRLLDNMDKRRRISLNYQATKRLVRITQRGLRALSPEERTILERMFINRETGCAPELSRELFVERATLYRMRDGALRKFTAALYGVEAG